MNMALSAIGVWCVVILLALPLTAGAALRPVTLSSDLKLPVLRGIYKKPSLPPKGSKVVKLLWQLKEHERRGQGKKCLAVVKSLNKLAKNLRPWLARSELVCSVMASSGKGRRYLSLLKATEKVDKKNPTWLLYGPQVKLLRQAYVDALIYLLQKQLKADRRRAWQTVDRLLQVQPWLTKVQKGQVYRFAGELAFIQQKLSLSFYYYRRSFHANPLSVVERRLQMIRQALQKKSRGQISQETQLVADGRLEASLEENKLYERIKTALDSRDLTAAVEDSVKLMEEFPGGSRSDWAAERVLEIISSLLSKSGSKFRLLKKQIMELMLTAAVNRQTEWAKRLFFQGSYLEALQLSELVIDRNRGRKNRAKSLFIAGQSAVFLGNYKKAVRHFEELVEKYGSQKEAAEGLLRLGMAYLRMERYDAGVAAFERLLVLHQGSRWELQAHYWKWRGLEKISKENADKEVKKLIQQFPLTYYGLRAKAEQNGNKLEFPQDSKGPVKVQLWLTQRESLAWERLQILLRAGWFKEAQAEIGELPLPQASKEKIVFSRLYALAFDYHKAITLANEAWGQDPEARRPALYPLSFPREFVHLIKTYSEKQKLNHNLVTALIKQESAFRPQAVSPAKATGLMQILPLTARDSAQYLKWKQKLHLPDDMFNPETNIYFGTSYLKRMVRAFNRHVPLALAAYNLGIGRLRKWLGNREHLKNLSERGSANPFDELWIDELPWSEPRYYVKAVMRNYFVYQVLERKQVELGDPIWANAIN